MRLGLGNPDSDFVDPVLSPILNMDKASGRLRPVDINHVDKEVHYTYSQMTGNFSSEVILERRRGEKRE